MDHSKHVRLTPTELIPQNLEGAAVFGPHNEKIGIVSQLHGTGPDSRVVVDVDLHSMLGAGAKPVALPISNLDFMRDNDGSVHAVTSWTKEQLSEQPDHRGF
ncbi:hypothetical protein EV667_3016 [Ancylobacter aquaticus]|uniref:PRC-barrel domain containing protein n=1 Tax=Ancylobacter aquaticus TaxID=100 RepID=A0A4R1I2I9_ANCAQ|nr:PRC-barrel domain containing protein [Ancylobacter aquaticus]TCK28998.1 hypothetical protein EV667_3016 [Ancylobacter aquaticus]